MLIRPNSFTRALGETFMRIVQTLFLNLPFAKPVIANLQTLLKLADRN